MARVLICDSHFAIQAALASKIDEAEDLELVRTTSSVEELIDQLGRTSVDVVVLELTLPGAVGLELVKDFRRAYEGLRIVVYTMYDETIYGTRAIRAGASGYVMKRENTTRVVEAIRTALQGEIFVSSDVFRHLSEDETLERLHPTNELTDEEMAVFQLLGEGCSIEEISSRLMLQRKQINDLEQQAMEKLDLETREALVQYASKIVHQ